MKLKKLAITALVAAMLVCSAAVPASASTTDTRYMFEWSRYVREATSPSRLKDTSTRVYFRTDKYTLPMKGYDVQTYLVSEDGQNPWKISSYWYTINNYSGYAINHRAGSKSRASTARLKTFYPTNRYIDGGDVTVWWSPDYNPDGSVLLG